MDIAEEIGRLIGVCYASGVSHDELLDMTFPQIALRAELLIREFGDRLEVVLSPIVAGLGKQYKHGEVAPAKAKGTKQTKVAKDADRLAMIMQSGFAYKEL